MRGALAKHRVFELKPRTQEASKLVSGRHFTHGKCWPFDPPEHLPVLGSRCGDRFSGQLIALKKECCTQGLGDFALCVHHGRGGVA